MIGTALKLLFSCAKTFKKLLSHSLARLVLFLDWNDALVDDCGSVVQVH